MQQTQGEVTDVTNTGRSHSYDKCRWKLLVQQTQLGATHAANTSARNAGESHSGDKLMKALWAAMSARTVEGRMKIVYLASIGHRVWFPSWSSSYQKERLWLITCWTYCTGVAR